MKTFICLVCGYNELEEPPIDEYGYKTFIVCPCCGFEFGFHDDDQGYTYEGYLKEWIQNGEKWAYLPKPEDFDLQKQLENIKQ